MVRIELVRKTTGLSKRRFSASIGISLPQNYSACLGGKMFLTVDQLYAIWQLYGADSAYVMAGREDGLTVALQHKLRAARETE